METRTIAIANTKTQKRYTLESAATTLGELKSQLTQLGVDFSGMTFTEGISKTQLIADDSLLPTNVMFKGQPTNNLVMLLTNPNKQIASGAVEGGSRKEAYAIIKELGKEFQDFLKEELGRNYTQVPTTDLWLFIDANTKEEEEEETMEEEHKECCCHTEPEIDFENTASAPHAGIVNWIYDGAKSMVNENALYIGDIEALAELFSEYAARLKETKANNLSDEDIDAIIAGI